MIFHTYIFSFAGTLYYENGSRRKPYIKRFVLKNHNTFSFTIPRKILIFCILILLLSAPLRAYAHSIPSSVVFFGDSTTAHLAVRGGIPASQVWSGAQSTVRFTDVNTGKCVHLSTGEDLTLFQAVKRAKPAVLVITIGVSGGAGVLSKEAFKEIYTQMLKNVRAASPSTKIYVQSILPLSDKSVKYYKKLTKESVTEANSWIKEVCASLGVPYINTHDLLTDESGYLKQEYQNDEYMHLTSKAYEVILANVGKTILN